MYLGIGYVKDEINWYLINQSYHLYPDLDLLQNQTLSYTKDCHHRIIPWILMLVFKIFSWEDHFTVQNNRNVNFYLSSTVLQSSTDKILPLKWFSSKKFYEFYCNFKSLIAFYKFYYFLLSLVAFYKFYCSLLNLIEFYIFCCSLLNLVSFKKCYCSLLNFVLFYIVCCSFLNSIFFHKFYCSFQIKPNHEF